MSLLLRGSLKMNQKITIWKSIALLMVIAFVSACDPAEETPADTTPYSYKDYTHSYSVKTFSETGTAFDTRDYVFQRSVGEVSYNRLDKTSGAIVRDRKFYFDTTGTTMDLYMQERNDVSVGGVTRTYTYSPGVAAAATDMVIGSPRMVTVDITRDGTYWETFSETLTLVGIEDVIVPFGAQTACLKTTRYRTANTQFGGERTMTQWRCAGHGVVKTVIDRPGLTQIVRVLTFRVMCVWREIIECDLY